MGTDDDPRRISLPEIGRGLLRFLLWLAAYVGVAALAVAALALGMLPFPLNLLALWIVETPLLYYLAMPICRWLRLFDYLSAYTILYGSKRRGKLALHLGMSHDLLWRLLPQRRPGERLIQTLNRDMAQGMAELCSRIEQGRIRPDAVISIGSYFLNPRKLERMGMRRKGPSFSNAINFLCAYPAIILDQLLLNGRIRWFNPFTVTTYTITATELLAHRAAFERRITGD